MVTQSLASSKADVTHGKLTIEQYAFILAHSLHFPKDDLPEVLARLAVEPEDWDVAVRAWPALMANEVRAEEDTLIMRFGAKFGATRTKLRADRPELVTLGPLPAEVIAAPAKAKEEKEKPVAPTTPAPPKEAVHLPVATPNPDHREPRASGTPSSWARGQNEAVPPPLVLAPKAIESLAGTSLAVEIPRALVMPFKKDAVPAKPTSIPAEPPPKKPERPRNPLEGTSMAVDIPRGEALPFARNKAGGPPPEPPKPVQPPLPPPSVKTVQPPLPPPSVKTVQPPLPPPSVKPVQPPPRPPAAPTAGPPPIPLERYASLCVELAMAPDRTKDTLARYLMTAETQALADGYWKAKMDHDPEIRKAWEQAYTVYRTWLMQSVPQSR